MLPVTLKMAAFFVWEIANERPGDEGGGDRQAAYSWGGLWGLGVAEGPSSTEILAAGGIKLQKISMIQSKSIVGQDRERRLRPQKYNVFAITHSSARLFFVAFSPRRPGRPLLDTVGGSSLSTSLFFRAPCKAP